jgi:tRNA(Ile)-lysidine synthase
VLSREQTESYVRARGYVPRLDESNLDDAYRRNALRHDLLPRLEHFNPRVRETLARSARSLERDADFLRQEARKASAAIRRPSAGGCVALDRQALALLHPGLRAHVIREVVLEIAGTLDGLRMDHVTALEAMAAGTRSMACRGLPQGLEALAEGNSLVLRRAPAGPVAKDASPAPSIALPAPGQAHFGEWTIAATLGSETAAESASPAISILVDTRGVTLPLAVRGRLPGDRVEPPGLHGHRKVQDILVDAKVARSRRDSIPVVVDQRGPIWIVGHAQDARTLLAEPSGPILQLIARRD